MTQLYKSKIIKAGALLSDTHILLAHWDESRTVAENLQGFRYDNIFGKTSRARVADMLNIFRQRYLEEEASRRALVLLAQNGFGSDTLNPILYFFTVRNDTLLQAVVRDLLAPRIMVGRSDITSPQMEAWVREQSDLGKTTSPWGTETIKRVTRNVMATLRDFGILEGAAHKTIAIPYLPLPAFAFIAYRLYLEESAGDALIHHPAWQWFFLTPLAVERFFGEAHMERLLDYRAAGRVVRITFPVDTLEDYAHVLTERFAQRIT